MSQSHASHAHPNSQVGGVTVDKVGSQWSHEDVNPPFRNLYSGTVNTSAEPSPAVRIPPPQIWDQALTRKKSFVQQIVGIMTVTSSSSKNDYHYPLPAPHPFTDEWHAQHGLKFSFYGKPASSNLMPLSLSTAHQITFESSAAYGKRLPGVAFSELLLSRGVKLGDRAVAEKHGIMAQKITVVFTLPHLPAYEATIDIRDDGAKATRSTMSLGQHVAEHFEKFIAERVNSPLPGALRPGSNSDDMHFNDFRLVSIMERSDGKWGVEVARAFR